MTAQIITKFEDTVDKVVSTLGEFTFPVAITYIAPCCSGIHRTGDLEDASRWLLDVLNDHSAPGAGPMQITFTILGADNAVKTIQIILAHHDFPKEVNAPTSNTVN